ncbi:MAG: ribbon-helix-helix domain-containing protein [Oscillospiraceae bacterium]|nr:ribbon-helix-helix domain-containing protein [Oscillospiraceae bacterium]
MSPRTGRPKSEKPKDVRFSIRLDVETYEQLQERSQSLSVTVAEAIRRAIQDFLGKKK